MELIDPVLLKSYSKKQSMQCLEIALSCVQENPTKRPTMDSVVSMLSSDSESLQLPKPSQPGFFRSSKSFSISVNDVSVTDLSARLVLQSHNVKEYNISDPTMDEEEEDNSISKP